MEIKKLTYQYAYIGHWLARCNHNTGVIELNSREWKALSPLMRDYVWVHECIHLLYDIRDESETNKLADEMFVSRARNARDRKRREEFVASANDLSFTRTCRPAPDKSVIFAAVLSIILIILIKDKQL